ATVVFANTSASQSPRTNGTGRTAPNAFTAGSAFGYDWPNGYSNRSTSNRFKLDSIGLSSTEPSVLSGMNSAPTNGMSAQPSLRMLTRNTVSAGSTGSSIASDLESSRTAFRRASRGFSSVRVS